MIIFDTSVLFGPGLEDSRFDVLWALKRSGQQRVAIPWMVREELVAHRTLDHAQVHEKAVAAVRALNRASSWFPYIVPASLDSESVKQHWRNSYEQLFEVIDTSGEAARQALVREAYCQKPANGPDRKDKGGARDAAIWLSVIDYLKANPSENVVFVSSNTSDFGDGVTYPSPMKKDLAGLEGRFTHLTSFDAVVSTFSTPAAVDGERIRLELAELLATPEIHSQFLSAMIQILDIPAFWRGNLVKGTLGQPISEVEFPSIQWINWVRPPKAILWHITDISGHRVGDEPWYTATVNWILTGRAVWNSSAELASQGQIACQWSTKLLFTSKQGEVPTILRHGTPDALPADKRSEWEDLVRPANATMDAQTARQLARSLFEAAAKATLDGSPVDVASITWNTVKG